MSNAVRTEFSILPKFDAWENYSSEELTAIVQSWWLILNSPAFQRLLNHAYQCGWQQWKEYGEKCIAEIKAEQEKREFPDCIECGSDRVKSLGVVPYNVPDDLDWYNDCEWMDGWECLECGDQFVTGEEEDEDEPS